MLQLIESMLVTLAEARPSNGRPLRGSFLPCVPAGCHEPLDQLELRLKPQKPLMQRTEFVNVEIPAADEPTLVRRENRDVPRSGGMPKLNVFENFAGCFEPRHEGVQEASLAAGASIGHVASPILRRAVATLAA
jgi:hypothetical protein